MKNGKKNKKRKHKMRNVQSAFFDCGVQDGGFRVLKRKISFFDLFSCFLRDLLSSRVLVIVLIDLTGMLWVGR